MHLYIDDLKKELYTNIRDQIEIQNKIVDLRKGNLIIKTRYNEEYYYLSYRDHNKVKTDYLGKLNYNQVIKIKNELEKRKALKQDLKDLMVEERQLRRLILAIDRKALIKKIYNVMDIIVIIRPILLWSKAKEAYLFGSYANGRMNESSDINIVLVDSNKDKQIIESKLEKLTNKTVNIIYNDDRISDKLRRNIEEEKLLIYWNTN